MSTVAIKPYLRRDIKNHGLEEAGLVIADGCEHGQWLRCLDNGNGVKTYITGLNEGVPEVQDLKEPQKSAKILDIRKKVVLLENQIAGNYSITEADIYTTKKVTKKQRIEGTNKWEEAEVDEQIFNPQFWSKVTKFKSVIPDEFDPNGARKPTYWDTVQLVCNNTPTSLDPKQPYNVMLITAIEAGGFGDLLAPSLEAANEAIHAPKFYLDKLEETAAVEVEDDRATFRAGAILEDIMEKNHDKLFYIVKNLAQFSLGYNRHTPLNIIYGDITKHLKGLGAQKNKRLAVEEFLDLCDSKKYTNSILRTRAIAKDAIAMNIIAPKGDGTLYHIKKGNPMGKNFEDIVMYLENPGNSDVMLDVTAAVENVWENK